MQTIGTRGTVGDMGKRWDDLLVSWSDRERLIARYYDAWCYGERSDHRWDNVSVDAQVRNFVIVHDYMTGAAVPKNRMALSILRECCAAEGFEVPGE